MNFKKYLFGALSLLTLSACSNEDAPAAPDAGQNGDTYATIRLSFATGSRSETITPPNENTNSSDGFEYGKDRENTITSLTILLATKTADGKYSIKAVSQSAADVLTSTTQGNTKSYTVLFQNEDLITIAGETVNIFAICNSNKTFDKETDLMTAIGSLEASASVAKAEAPWSDDHFLMTNASRTTQDEDVPSVTLPGKDNLFKDHNKPEKAFYLGEVRVARVVARFDFKQINNNLYDVHDVNAEKDDKGNIKDPAAALIAQVKLLAMAPVNIAKDFYYLPRVSADGTNDETGDGWTICGIETPTNWVVSPNYAAKNGSTVNVATSLFGKYQYQTPLPANSPSYSDENYFNYTDLATFDGEDDNDENWGPGNSGIKDYKIWRYVTENTIPAVAAQKKGISTGVIFKAEIVNPKAESNLAKAMTAKAVVYGYDGVYYGDLEALRAAAANQTESSNFRAKFLKVFGENSLEKDEDGNFTETIADCTADQNANTFKILRPDTDGHYYVYYLYRNRHNDNGNNGLMAAMEFATVRNNVYKLSVTSISDFGHTDNPGDDPDPEDPDDPDEEEKVYFRVSCRVVPWMVRINSIEF